MDWWDQEPELLGVTLGMLASWPGDIALENGTDNSASDEGQDDILELTECTAVRPYRSGRSVNVSRERRRQEALYLRKKVDSMQRKLDALQRRRDEMLLPHYRDFAKGQLATVAPIWESMAKNQFQARRRSELRNVELKAMLAAQSRVAEDLQRTLQRAHQESGMGMVVPRPVSLRASIWMSQDEQLQRVEKLSTEWASIYTISPRFEQGPLDFFDMYIAEDNGLEKVIEICCSGAVPFPVNRVEGTVWSFLSGDCPPEECDGTDDDDLCYVKNEVLDEDTAITAFTSMPTMDESSKGRTSGRWVIKRLAVFGGTQRLHISHSISEREGFGNEMDGAIINEDSWVRFMDASELGHGKLATPVTVIQHVQRMRVTFREHHGVMPDSVRLKELTKVIMKETEDEFEWLQQSLEDSLMDGNPLTFK